MREEMLRYIIFMNKVTGLIACLLLLSLAVAQTTTTTTTCSPVSGLSGIASGIINLGVPTASVAQTSYSLSLSGFSLGTFAEVFTAFAIAGFQGASSQQYFSLVVDTVVFSNGNTQMNFTMNYNNPTGSFQTTWSSVKLSWVAVSTGFQTVTGSGQGNYIWAGSVGVASPFTNGISGPVIPNSIWGAQTTAMATTAECGYINTSPPAFDVTCFGATNPRFLTHLYIMGFQFDPTSGSYSLAASVLRRGGTNVVADLNEALLGTTTGDFVVRTVGGASSTADLTGPQMLINPLSPQLSYLKIGIVITTILDTVGYPTNNPASFQYSGVYMNYTLFNLAQPISRPADTSLDGQDNYNYLSLLNIKYTIFGLSAFYIAKLPAEVTVINYNLDFSGVNTVLLQTDNVNYMSGVKISADQWNNIISCPTETNNMLNIRQKYLATVPPIQNAQQNIFETSSALDFNYFAAGIYSAATSLSATVLFTNIMYFQNISPGMAHRIRFRLSYLAAAIPLGTGTTSSQVQYTLSAEGNQILNRVITLPNPAAAGQH